MDIETELYNKTRLVEQILERIEPGLTNDWEKDCRYSIRYCLGKAKSDCDYGPNKINIHQKMFYINEAMLTLKELGINLELLNGIDIIVGD